MGLEYINVPLLIFERDTDMLEEGNKIELVSSGDGHLAKSHSNFHR
jgi:hypothetical protein